MARGKRAGSAETGKELGGRGGTLAALRVSRRLAHCEAWQRADLLRHALAQIRGSHKADDLTCRKQMK